MIETIHQILFVVFFIAGMLYAVGAMVSQGIEDESPFNTICAELSTIGGIVALVIFPFLVGVALYVNF